VVGGVVGYLSVDARNRIANAEKDENGVVIGMIQKDAAALEDSRQGVAWEARNAKGADRQLLREEEQRLQDLIDGLQRGDKVDQAEIDRVLGRTR
jgi:hypothetical protein